MGKDIKIAFDEESYRQAARDNLTRAQELFENGSYFLSFYLSGLAVECHLRAWRYLQVPGFEHNHNLSYLAEVTGFLGMIRGKGTERFSAAFSFLSKTWRSNHRFCAERQFYQNMGEKGVEKRSMGSDWKEVIAHTALNSAHEVFKQGEAKWT